MEIEDHDSQGRVVEDVAVQVVREEGELQGQVARLLAVLPQGPVQLSQAQAPTPQASMPQAPTPQPAMLMSTSTNNLCLARHTFSDAQAE